MPAQPTVADFMVTDLYTLSPDTDIRDAVDFLLEHKISGAPVVDQSGALLGVISEKDCLKLLAKGADHQRVAGTVAEYMTTHPETIPSHMDIYFAAGMFLNRSFRRFPVVDEGKLVGQISRRDILNSLQQLMPRA
jgi:CBS domain-containing protein